MKRTRILSGAAALLVIATAAQAQQRQDDHHNRQDQRGHVSPQVQHGPGEGNPERSADAQRRGIDQARAGQGAPRKCRINSGPRGLRSSSASSRCVSASRRPSSSERSAWSSRNG